MNNTLTVMVGLQGSGKSTIAKAIRDIEGEGSNWIVSSDEIRHMNPTWGNEQVFKKLYELVNFGLKNNKNMIIDATNVTIKSRKKIFENVKEPCQKIAYIINTPIEVCRERVIERNKDINSHKVPLDVLDKYWKSFQVPFKEEGFDEIWLYDDPNNCAITDLNYISIFKEMVKFNQDNQHHTQTLGIHSRNVWNNLREELFPDKADIEIVDVLARNSSKEFASLYRGCNLHDVGKLWTKVYKEGDSNAHYYNHAEVGSYWKLCNGWAAEDAFYECYHMRARDWTTDKAKEKAINLFGEEKFNNLLLLRECDNSGHV